MRSVDGLRWAKMIEGQPSFVPASNTLRLSGAKSEGIRYERGLAKGLGARFRHGMWWEFKDNGGVGYCQTDFFGRAKEWVVLLESKLTWTMEAEDQLRELYVPVVACALRVPKSQVLPIVVCKYLAMGLDRPVEETLRGALLRSMDLGPPFCSVWHHIGGVPMLMSEEMING